MSNRISVIDLGTNTFHILTVEIVDKGDWLTLDRERVFVNLASEGIELISEEAALRGIETMRRFLQRAERYDVNRIYAFGTAALRTASNSAQFLERVKQATGIQVDVISGDREAELITIGVLHALPTLSRPFLIMDIGGGSVEMILVNDDRVIFSQSYPVGVAILYQKFHSEEPISAESLRRIDAFLDVTFSELLRVLSDYPEVALVGASGTFEVVESILDQREEDDLPAFSSADPADFEPLYLRILAMNLEERLADPDIPDTRARYIVVAVHLIAYILQRVSQDAFYISAYAMKEGIVVEHSK